MHQTYTSENLVQMLYRELPAEAVKALTIALSNDTELQNRYSALRRSKSMLPQATFDPSPGVIDRILRYSVESAI